MPFSTPLLVESLKVTRDSLASDLRLLQGSWKSSSLVWMQANGLPVLPSVILGDFSRGAEAAVLRFCRESSFSELLVRIEKPGQRWTRRRGGYIIPVSSARDLVSELEREGMLTILLEPASPYSDLYSLASVCDLHAGKIDIELVGPGFDASDILRSDVTPHERFEFWLDSDVQSTRSQIKRLQLIEPEAYRISAQRRLAKIGAALRNPSFPDEVTGFKPEQLSEEAVRYLRETGQTLLLDHLDEYKPIPPSLLEGFVGGVRRLCMAARDADAPWKALSAAGSFLNQNRLVMWDFFAPSSYETTVLSRMAVRQ